MSSLSKPLGLLVKWLGVITFVALFGIEADCATPQMGDCEANFVGWLGRPSEIESKGKSKTLYWNRVRASPHGRKTRPRRAMVYFVEDKAALIFLGYRRTLSTQTARTITKAMLPSVPDREFVPYFSNESERMFSFSTSDSLVWSVSSTGTGMRFAGKLYLESIHR